MVLFVFLSSFALAETAATPNKEKDTVAQYTIKDGNGTLLFELAIRASKPDTLFLWSYKDGREYFIQKADGTQDTFIIFDKNRVFYKLEPYNRR